MNLVKTATATCASTPSWKIHSLFLSFSSVSLCIPLPSSLPLCLHAEEYQSIRVRYVHYHPVISHYTLEFTQIVFDYFTIMLYLEDYLEMIEHLPGELRDRFTEIRELDLQVHSKLVSCLSDCLLSLTVS